MKKILIIEDDLDIAEIVEMALADRPAHRRRPRLQRDDRHRHAYDPLDSKRLRD